MSNIIKKIICLGIIISLSFYADFIYASGLTHILVRPDRMAKNNTTGYFIVFRPSVNLTNQINTRITFPNGLTLSAPAISLLNIPATVSGTGNITPLAGSSIFVVNANAITISHPNLVVGTSYGFYIQGITNPSTVGQYIVSIETLENGNNVVSRGFSEFNIVETGSPDKDQILVRAEVARQYTLSVNKYLVDFGYPNVNQIYQDSVSINVKTNAFNGHHLLIKTNYANGLSGPNGNAIPIVAPYNGISKNLSAYAKGFVTGFVNINNDPNITISPEYNATLNSTYGGSPTTNYQSIASRTLYTNTLHNIGDDFVLQPKIKIDQTVPYGSYGATLTIGGAGDF